jgi:hypothetical protein
MRRGERSGLAAAAEGKRSIGPLLMEYRNYSPRSSKSIVKIVACSLPETPVRDGVKSTFSQTHVASSGLEATSDIVLI